MNSCVHFLKAWLFPEKRHFVGKIWVHHEGVQLDLDDEQRGQLRVRFAGTLVSKWISREDLQEYDMDEAFVLLRGNLQDPLKEWYVAFRTEQNGTYHWVPANLSDELRVLLR